MNYKYLGQINTSEQLRALKSDELKVLCEEIRTTLIERVLENGGHLASNLGVVELTVALHRIFDSPNDKIIWDVGHQSYVHKLLTGRFEGFDTLRKPGGMSGFTYPIESMHDHTTSGHASVSISSAIGFAQANRLKGGENFAIAVAGDGAFTGGMIHEALNNCDPNLRIVIILNDNEMSISHNTGRFSDYMSRIRTSKRYYKVKRKAARMLRSLPLVGRGLFGAAKKHKQRLKGLVYPGNYFEQMGIYYLGPVDGHDIPRMERLLREAKESAGCTLIHVRTTKGKGYTPAEENPNKYHGVAPADKQSGSTFSQKAGEILLDRAKKDERICAITAAMSDGCGLSKFAAELPERFFDVGIAEPHALTFAAGLAAAGMKPVVGMYSTFLQRAYDNIIHDIALDGLPVTVFIDRAGVNIADGPTHHGIFDVSMLSQIPGTEIYTPFDCFSLHHAIDKALASGKPSFVRYHSGSDSTNLTQRFTYNPGSVYRNTLDFDSAVEVVIITYGRIAAEAVRAYNIIREGGMTCGVIALEQLRPYGEVAAEIAPLLAGAKKIVFLEEGILAGGAGMMLRSELEKHATLVRADYNILAIDDHFARAKSDESIWRTCGIDAESVVEWVNIR